MERFDKDTRKMQLVNLKHMPHTLLFSADYGALIKCFIFFPGMYEKENETQSFLSLIDQALFVDKVFLPSVKNVCDDDICNRMPMSYNHSAGRGLTLKPTGVLTGGDIRRVVVEMRRWISEKPEYQKFDSFYFATSAFGFKESFEGKLDSVLSRVINWNEVDKTRARVDVACNVKDKSRSGIFFLRGESSKEPTTLFNINKKDVVTLYPSLLGAFGSVKVLPLIIGENSTVPVPSKLIVYTNLKGAFLDAAKSTGKTTYLSELWKPMEIWSANNSNVNRINVSLYCIA